MINKRNEAWLDKERRKEMAQRHLNYVYNNYYDDTCKSINGTEIHEVFKINDNEWSENHLLNSTIIPIKQEDTIINVTNGTTVDAINRYYRRYGLYNNEESKTAALNFASYKNPGGKFLEGSIAQEEFLCHSSNLYNILMKFDESYYKINRQNTNNHLYHSNLLYTPSVIFIDKNVITARCDIITCAAPNTHAAMKYANVSYEECLKSMIERVDHVLNAAYKHHVKNLILGAFGCGVFGNNATDVASVFMSLLNTKYNNVFKMVEFAIPISAYNNNNEEFYNVLRIFEAFKKCNIDQAIKKFPLTDKLIGERPWRK